MHHIRSYRAGDEAILVEIAERAHAPYGGSVPRTVAHWRWSILDRPGIASDDILILGAATGETLGYAVLGRGGVVLEFCLEPKLTGEARTEAARALKRALEERCLATGQETIVFELPHSDGRVRALLAADGYRQEESQSLQLILVDVEEAIRRLLAHRRGRLPHDWRPVFRFELAPGHYRRSGPLILRIAPGEAETVVRSAPDVVADVTVRTDLSTLTDLMFRRVRFEEARSLGRIEVVPAAREQDARTLCDWLVLKNPWYTPPADGR